MSGADPGLRELVCECGGKLFYSRALHPMWKNPEGSTYTPLTRYQVVAIQVVCGKCGKIAWQDAEL
jgi:hypothetical protein